MTWKNKATPKWFSVTDCDWLMAGMCASDQGSPWKSQHHVEVIPCASCVVYAWLSVCVFTSNRIGHQVSVGVAHYAGQDWVLQSSSHCVVSVAGWQKSAGTTVWESFSTHSQTTWRLPGKSIDKHPWESEICVFIQRNVASGHKPTYLWLVLSDYYDLGSMKAFCVFSPVPQVVLHSVCPVFVHM